MIKIYGVTEYKAGEDIYPGVLYKLTEGMVVEGKCEFQVFGEVFVDGVYFQSGTYAIDCPGRLTIDSPVDSSAVLFKTGRMVRSQREPLVPLPLPEPVDDPMRAAFRQWAIDLGLIKADQVLDIEEPDDLEEDEEWEFDLDQDGLVDEESDDEPEAELRPVEAETAGEDDREASEEVDEDPEPVESAEARLDADK